MAGAPAAQLGGVALSTRDTVTFGFGLEQVNAATRNEQVRRSLLHLLPAGADTTAPTVAFTYPAEGSIATPRDPVELEVDAIDERGDLKEVRLVVGDELIMREKSFPFQLRWTPKATERCRSSSRRCRASRPRSRASPPPAGRSRA